MGRARGSGRVRIEDCLSIDATVLRRCGVFASAFGSEWTYQWSGGSTRNINCTVAELPGKAMGLRLRYQRSDVGYPSSMRFVVQTVPVISSVCPFGGRRFWLQCPLMHSDVRCTRRVTRLFLAPCADLFACRMCYDLRYTTTQIHDKRVDHLARDLTLLRLALEGPDVRLGLLGVAALRKVVQRLKRRGIWARRYGLYGGLSEPEF